MADSSKPRLDYIDNLRIFLISLVALHHLAITYGASGDWYYNESSAGFPEIVPYSMFTATNQAFFMGMFFFISAYFMVPSLRKKGSGQFSKERLIRLGIPTLLYFFFLHPLAVFIRYKFIMGEDVSLVDYIFRYKIFGFGPMWFVEALLIFTFIYVLFKSLWNRNTTRAISFPSSGVILLFAFLIGLGQYVIRMWLPVGWSMPFTSFQFPHFLQYILLFIAGIIAYENNWMDAINSKMGWNWFIFVQVMIFVSFPIVFIAGGAMEGNIEPFMGRGAWQSFAYAMWEQFVGIGLILALFGIFKSRLNRQNSLAKKLSASAYGVYVFHAPLLVLVSAVFLDFQIPQFFKFIVLAPVALILCFTVGYLVKKAPITRKIF